MSETFTYDNLHRVLSRTVNTAANLSGNLTLSESYAYDENGNLLSKGNVGYYQYNVANKPNRLAGIWQHSNFSGTKHYSFSYDNNGNVTDDGKRSFLYTSFDKPSRITQGTNTTDFSYGPARELYKRVDVRAGQTTSTLMIDGIYEQVTLPSGVVEHKYSVGDAVVTKRSNGDNVTNYVHKDHLGSTIAVTKADGNILQQFIYDPWGKQYTVYSDTASMLNFTAEATSKGYTGHEMVNDFDVIHMGGRTYNPVLGRFMQADPNIQFAGNLQSYNRYSYVMNNPMKYTDPSGYFLASIFKSFSRSVLKMIPQSVGNFLISIGSKLCGPWAGACAAGATYEFSRAHGMSRTGALRAAAAAGLSAYAFEKIGKNFSELGGQNVDNVVWGGGQINDYVDFGGNLLTPGQVARQITAHAAVGGIVSSIGGGKFGHGFFSAGVTKGLGTPISDHFDQGVISGTVTQMVIGGTASIISGGKFANGARTAAYQTLFNYFGDNFVPGTENVDPEDSNYPFSRNAEKTLETSMSVDTEKLKESSLGKYRVAIGQEGEVSVWKTLLEAGYEVYTDGVAVDYGGSYRIYDGAYRKPGGDWILIETKTNTSPLIKRQIVIDRRVSTIGFTGVRSGPAGLVANKPYTVQLFRVIQKPGR